MLTEVEEDPNPKVAPDLNFFQRLGGILFSPVDTLRSVVARPDVVVPLVVIVIISLVTTMLVVPHIDMEGAIRDQFASNPNMPPEKVDDAVERTVSLQKVLFPVFAVVGVPLMLAAMAAIFLLAFNLMGGEVSYFPIFAVTIYSWIPQTLKGVLATAVIVPQGKFSPEGMMVALKSNLGFLVDPQSSRMAFSVLSSLDVFTFWTLALMIIGYSLASRLSRTTSAAIVLTLWGVILLGKLGMAALQASVGA